MKYLESEFYSGGWYFGNQSYATIRNWFRIKDKAFQGIKHVTKRHIRSIVVRNLKKLRGRINYYAHQYRKPHRVIIITKPTSEWFLEQRGANNETKRA